MTDEKDEINTNHLQAKAQLAGCYREMCQSPAFIDLRKYIEAKMVDAKNEWFRASPEESEKIKIRAQVFNEIFDLIKSRVMAGDHASQMLNKINEEKKQI